MKDKLLMIQMDLKAPKGQMNKFGGYKYRSCEDIFEAVKPLLEKYNLILTTTDELQYIGERYYIKATAILTDIDSNNQFINVAYAREEETKKGMDGSQVTGASSSYARKYALNGLFLIDDVKDSDTTNDGTGTVVKNDNKKLELMVRLNKLVEEKQVDREKLYEYYKVKDNADMSVKQLEEAIKTLEERK